MLQKGILLFLILSVGINGFSQNRHLNGNDTKKAIEIAQWTVHDIVFTAKKIEGNPFDLSIDATVSSEKGTQTIPLFYNGNKEWILRFSAHETGTYQYTVNGNLAGVSNNKGSFIVTQNTKPNRHGGIVLNSDDPQHLYYQDGKGYFNLAFECDWLFALDYGQKELPKTKQLLNTIAENGFNQIVMNVYSHDVNWKKDPKLADHPEHEYGGKLAIFPFKGDNKHPNFEELNVAFFQHLDKTLAEMHDRELVSHLMIYVWNKMVNWPDMNTAADNRYFDYVLKRYQAYPNLVWDVSKEALFYGRATEEYISERIQRIRKMDSYHRLVSVHDYGFCKKHPEEVDFLSSQDWTHTLYEHMLKARQQFPNKPVFNIEHGGYEESAYEVFTGDYVNAEVCLRRNYMCLFAGVYTTYYWQGASWNVLIHNPFELSGEFPKPKFEYFAHLKGLFDKYPFENFVPNPGKNTSGYNLTDSKNGVTLVYMPKENYAVKLWYMEKETEKTATMQFFNTLTGTYTPVENFKKEKAERSPWSGQADTILIVQRK